MSHPTEFFTISRVCELTGVGADRLAQIEGELGEHMAVRRTRAGNRLFTQADVDRLQEVLRLLDDDGLDMDQVKAILFSPPLEATPADTLPGLPSVEPTMDLLLEAAEGLVQENLRLKAAVDSLGERCLHLEERLEEMSRGRSRWRFLSRF